MNNNASENLRRNCNAILLAGVVFGLGGCASSRPSSGIVEWAEFAAAPGISDEQLFKASDAVQRNFLRNQRGFLGRELLKGKNGQWVDVLYWTDQRAADEAARNAQRSSTCADYFRCMADPEAEVLHFQPVKRYGLSNSR